MTSIGTTVSGALAALLIASALPVGAEPGEATDATPPPGVDLDSLFRLPKASPRVEESRPGGLSRKQWAERFEIATGDVAESRAALGKARGELEEMAAGTDSWQLAAPGAPAGSDNSPLSYKLRQEIRQHRDELAAAERRYEELRIEANLAGVPEEWQQ
jgi:hypothetical protein